MKRLYWLAGAFGLLAACAPQGAYRAGRGPGGGPGGGGGARPCPCAAAAESSGPGAPRGDCGIDAACALQDGPLAAPVLEAVTRALADERAAEIRYAALARIPGAERPFAHIGAAEHRHAAALERLLTSHGAPIPPAPASDGARADATDRRAACVVGTRSERDNLALYDALLAADLPADVRCVFERLAAASRDRHLPAFERCAGAS